MESFKIEYEYDHKRHIAMVTRSEIDRKIQYSIKLFSPEIIQKFGREIVVFKDGENYSFNTAKDTSYMQFVNMLANKLP